MALASLLISGPALVPLREADVQLATVRSALRLLGSIDSRFC